MIEYNYGTNKKDLVPPHAIGYRAWASLAEMVEDGAHEWWFIQIYEDDGTDAGSSCRILSLDIVFGGASFANFVLGEDIYELPFSLIELFEGVKCSPSPLGPWRTCGRKMST
jgi:hypothetical protein